MQYEIVNERNLTDQTKGTVLSKIQKDYYARDGYLVIKNFISTDICNYLISQADRLINEFDPGLVKTIFSTQNPALAKQQYFLDSGDKIHFFFEENAFDKEGQLRSEKKYCINKIGHALHAIDPAFFCFSHLDKIAATVHDLNIIDPRIVQSMYICKQPNFGGEVICHQDSTYLYIKGQPVTGFWFALEDATLENGCLWAIPGGHKTPLKSRMLRDKSNNILTEVYDDTLWPLEKMIPLEVPRGSLIVLHGLLPHMSKENLSNRSRHAYTLHMMSGKDEFAEDNWLRLAEDSVFAKII